MDIGVPSVRNLFKIKRERALLWMAIGVTSIPLHLLYNSAVYTSLAANDFLITIVTNNHFEKGSYTNTTIAIGNFRDLSPNAATGKKYGEIGYQADLPEIQLFSSILEGYNVSTEIYKDLKPLECAKAYNTDFVSNNRNLFLITKNSSNATHNNTILDMIRINSNGTAPTSWMCTDSDPSGLKSAWCDTNKPVANLTSGLPWRMNFSTAGVVDIAGCKSEITDEKCKVEFSLEIMIVVICCNLVKACCMITAVVRSQEPTLVTLGDAVDSFLRAPDPTTKGMCFADREFIKGEWKHEWKTRPRKWKKKGLQRWWTSVGRTRWVTCYFFCLLNIFYLAGFLATSIQSDRQIWSMDLKSMWTRGLGKVNGVSILASLNPSNVTLAILLSNIPQTTLSFLYLIYNSLFTCMLSGHEWSLFGHHHRTLRIPYTYAIPLMTLSGLLHWLTSQSIFFARVDISDPFGRDTLEPINAVGYSCIAIIFALLLGILALISAVGMGYRQFASEITTAGSFSAAISAACHTSEVEPEEILGRKVRWGDVGIMSDLGVRHLTFSSEEGVGKPVIGEVYAGIGRGGSDCL
ncbi:hypothetical protein B9Z19DRAFT_1172619 [Tuber borchii]|uniref:DUF6536 domain-containing protein n=1 Tax=Tuber borchii TaxID=42251 RepID=A0A2T6Z9J8_TUBBO|nr:hypothetical protein B9Z19DRAFT_1172619 [Tuber borchii]